jgi:hypothetical protein
MSSSPRVTVVVESYNHGEGTGLDLLASAIESARQAVAEYGSGEVLLADAVGEESVAALAAGRFPDVRVVTSPGAEYDEIKSLAAQAAAGTYVVFLDGDCRPAERATWLASLLAPLERGESIAAAGFTRYTGGFLASLLTLIDFGFLIPRVPRNLECYASNNSAFRRDDLVNAPCPRGMGMRCHCFLHAQEMKRRGTPIRLAPDAIVFHALPEFREERFRRGYDLVAACWLNPALPEARFLKFGLLAAPVFYAGAVALSFARLARGYRDVGLRAWQLPFGFALLPFLQLVDFAGIVTALTKSPRRRREGMEAESVAGSR